MELKCNKNALSSLSLSCYPWIILNLSTAFNSSDTSLSIYGVARADFWFMYSFWGRLFEWSSLINFFIHIHGLYFTLLNVYVCLYNSNVRIRFAFVLGMQVSIEVVLDLAILAQHQRLNLRHAYLEDCWTGGSSESHILGLNHSFIINR